MWMSSLGKPPSRNLPARYSAITGTWCSPIEVCIAMIERKISSAWVRVAGGARGGAPAAGATTQAAHRARNSRIEFPIVSCAPSANDPCALALHDGFNFPGVDLGGIAGRRHRQRAVCGAVLDRCLRALAFEERIREAGRETVAAADAIVDLQVFSLD